MSEIIYRKLTDIKKLPNNPRTIKKDDMERLKKSIKDNPDYFEARPIILSNRTGELVILAGNQRYEAAKALKMDEVPTYLLEGLTEAREREIIIRDSVSNGDWDMDALANEWDTQELVDWGLDLDWASGGGLYDDFKSGSLKERFIMPPYSILDTRQKYWQDRKKSWIGLGIKSEEGRSDSLLGDGLNKLIEKSANFSNNTTLNGTSVFDPVLCEIAYKWFCPSDGSILDPFAGGSVRGIVAARTGHPYTGLELRGEQVDANKKQAKDILTTDDEPADWITGDSNKTLGTLKGEYDMIFSCPPYADLEVYSDDPADLSNMPYSQFKATYREIINKAVLHLKDDRFAVFVVGEVRDNKHGGAYRGFVQDTIDAFVDAGCVYYNEIILLNAVGTAGLRATKVFNSGRKVVKLHQNVLVFYKGDTKKIKEIFPVLSEEELEDYSGE